MNIKRIVVGDLAENCYIIEKDNSCLIVDPGAEFNKIKDNIDKEVKGVLITHSHFDHIGALQEVIDTYHVKVNDKFAGFDYEIIETNGHTNDSKSFYFKDENIMFTGDFLFQDSIGRLDLGGNKMDMLNSLNIIKKYPQETNIYPGHGDKTTLKDELNNIEHFIYILTEY